MGGSIHVESEPGNGSCFDCTVAMGATARPSEMPAVGRHRLINLRVLVVDDNLTNRRVLVDALKLWGIRATAVASDPEALAALERSQQSGEPFDAVLTDMHMPETDGFDLVQRIRTAAARSRTCRASLRVDALELPRDAGTPGPSGVIRWALHGRKG
jgi:two-component system sensor histidine kinase/response regulator